MKKKLRVSALIVSCLFLVDCKPKQIETASTQGIFNTGLDDKNLEPFGCPSFLIRRNKEDLQLSKWDFGNFNVHKSCVNQTKKVIETGHQLETLFEKLAPIKLENAPMSVSKCLAPTLAELKIDQEQKNIFSRAVVADYYHIMNKISSAAVGTIEHIANLDMLLGEPVPLPIGKSSSKAARYADKYVPRTLPWVAELGNSQTCRRTKVAIAQGSILCRGKQTGLDGNGDPACFVEPFELLLEQSRIAFRALAKVGVEIGKLEKKLSIFSLEQYLTKRPSYDNEASKVIGELEIGLKGLEMKSGDTGIKPEGREMVERILKAARPHLEARLRLIELAQAWISTVPWLKVTGLGKENFTHKLHKYTMWETYFYKIPENFDAKAYWKVRHIDSFEFKNSDGATDYIDVGPVVSNNETFMKRVGVIADMAVRDPDFKEAVLAQLRKNRETYEAKLATYYKAARCLHTKSDALLDKPIIEALTAGCKKTVLEVVSEIPEVYPSESKLMEEIAFYDARFSAQNKAPADTQLRLNIGNELYQAQCRAELRQSNKIIEDTRVSMQMALAFSGVGILQSAKYGPMAMDAVAAEYANAGKISTEAYTNYLKVQRVYAQAAAAGAQAKVYTTALRQAHNVLGFTKVLAAVNAGFAAVDVAGAMEICQRSLRETMSTADRKLADQFLHPLLQDRPTCPATEELYTRQEGQHGELRVLPVKTQRALIANAESAMFQCVLGVGLSVTLNSVQALDDLYRLHTGSKTIKQIKALKN